MTFTKTATLAGIALVAITSPSYADSHSTGLTFDGAISLGYNMNSIDIPGTGSADLDGFNLDIDGDLIFNDRFKIGIGLGYGSGDLSLGGLGSVNLDLLGVSIEPQYSFENGFYVGGYYRLGDLDLGLLGPVTVGVDTHQYGLFGGYEFGAGHVEVFYGKSDGDSGIIPVPLSLDVTDFGISGAYQFSPQFEIFASYLRTDVDVTGGSVPIDSMSVGLDYSFNEQLTIYGAIGRTDIGLGGLGEVDATGMTLGLSYELGTNGGLPIILSAEYSRTSIGGLGGAEPEIDRIALGATIPFGAATKTKPLNTNTRAARGDYRSAISAIANAF